MTRDDTITAGLPPAARKAALRRAVLSARDRIPAQARDAAAQAVARRTLDDAALAPVLARGIVAGYWPIRSELDPRPLMLALQARGAGLALPVVTDRGLVFRRWREADTLVDAGFGTLGPSPDNAELCPDILLVPLAAFDRAGNRIGYGQGHYDGAIARLAGIHDGKAGPAIAGRQRRLPLAIGVAHDLQRVDAIPAEPHDQPLDAIITPTQSFIID